MVREAFESGEISYSKVRAITRVADWRNEVELVDIAKANTAAHVAKIVKGMRQVERLKESKAAFDAYRRRTFECHTDEDGSLVFEADCRRSKVRCCCSHSIARWTGCSTVNRIG